MGVQWHKRPTQLGGRTQWGFVTSCVSTPTISRRKQSRPRSASRLGDSFSTILVGVALACERALRHAYANLARLAHPKSQAGSASPVLRLRVKEAPGVDSRRLANGALSNLSQFRGCRGGQVQRPRVAPKGCHVLLRQQPPGRTDRRRVHLTLEETAERVLCLDHLSQMRRGVFEGKFILAEAVPFWGRERWQICSHAADLYVLAGFRESSGVEVLHPEPSPSPRAVGLTVPGPQSPTTLPTTGCARRSEAAPLAKAERSRPRAPTAVSRRGDLLPNETWSASCGATTGSPMNWSATFASLPRPED